MTDPNAHKPPKVDQLQYASEHARRAASALLALEPVFMTAEEREHFADLADQLEAIAKELWP